MFPIRDAQGSAIAFGGRVLDARMPKYINSPESPLYSKARTLYGLFEARQAISSSAPSGKDRAILVEGYFDVIALWQAGFKEAVAGCGTALTVEQLRVLSRYTKNVIACFDGDAAGRKASMRALEIFLQAGLLGRGIFIPSGFDPDTFIRERGAAAFAELIGQIRVAGRLFSERAGERGARLDRRARAGGAARRPRCSSWSAIPFSSICWRAKPPTCSRLARKCCAKRRADRIRGPRRRRGSRAIRARTRAAARRARAAATPARRPNSAWSRWRCCIRNCATKLRSPGAAANFEEIRRGGVLADLCRTDEPYTALEQWIADRLSADEQSRVSEFAVGPLNDDIEDETQKDPNDLEKCRALVNDYVVALERRRRARELGRLRQSAAEVSTRESEPGEAAAAAQAVIALRREGRGAGVTG